ncbi:MAG TPA: ribonuclease PH [Candidatus Poseidoniales archaeon]|jgi:ribonuclease PH|nr:ribonuclease PH [Euryarchaeota archaeon]DAC68180.1 MAG TPA: ribonuclease PH [Candidatus Poseidoniales archaeon]|tara:strand:+ start:2436 stop:3260 length:825 start_codon:yes stop_codon:yes gene_type:complete
MAKFKTELTTSRNADEMRSVEVEIDFTSNALASILYRQGETVVLACCTKEARLPGWFPRDSTKGWVHAEYSLLPGSTDSRFRRERRGAKGRTQEIERLVARSLRAAVDLEELGPIALNVDCDILNADGGTRCASITAANLALRLGVRRLIAAGVCLPKNMRPTEEQRRSGWSPPVLSEEEQMAHEMRVMEHDVAAISVGLIDGKSYLDLDYNLDSNADVDMNVVKVSNGAFVEVQGTGEESTYQREELDALLDMADVGFEALFEMQKTILHGQQ